MKSIKIDDSTTLHFKPIKPQSGSIIPPLLKLISLGNYDNKIFLFGGQTKKGIISNGISCTNDMYAFDLTRKNWKMIEQKGEIPSPRCAYALCCEGRYMYLFGGRDTSNKTKFNDFFQFNMVTEVWKRINTSGEKPTRRDTPLSYLLNNRMYVYGGHEGYNYVSDLHVVDLTSFVWKKITYLSPPPPLLLGQSLLFKTSTEFVFYGGLYDQEQSRNVFSNESFSVNIKKMKFEKVTMTEPHRPATFGHLAFEIEKGKSIVLGGSVHSYFQNDYNYVDDVFLFVNDTENKKVVSKKVGNYPSRCFSSLVQINRNKWVLFGGRTKKSMEGTNDLLSLTLQKMYYSPFKKLLTEEYTSLSDTIILLKNSEFLLANNIFISQSRFIRKRMYEIDESLLDSYNLKKRYSELKIKWCVSLKNFRRDDFVYVLYWMYGSKTEKLPINRLLTLYRIGKWLELPEFMYRVCQYFEQELFMHSVEDLVSSHFNDVTYGNVYVHSRNLSDGEAKKGKKGKWVKNRSNSEKPRKNDLIFRRDKILDLDENSTGREKEGLFVLLKKLGGAPCALKLSLNNFLKSKNVDILTHKDFSGLVNKNNEKNMGLNPLKIVYKYLSSSFLSRMSTNKVKEIDSFKWKEKIELISEEKEKTINSVLFPEKRKEKIKKQLTNEELKEELSENFKNSANFTLICEDGFKFVVHKEILLCSSDYFKKMLMGGFVESFGGVNEVKESIPTRVLGLWIHYFYSNEVSKITKSGNDITNSNSQFNGKSIYHNPEDSDDSDIDIKHEIDLDIKFDNCFSVENGYVEEVTTEEIVKLSLLADEKCMFSLKKKCMKVLIESISKENILKTLLLSKPLLEDMGFFKMFLEKMNEIENVNGEVFKSILLEAQKMSISKYSFEST